MSDSDAACAEGKSPSALPSKYVVGIVIAVAVALLPVLGFLILVEREVSQYSTASFESCARKALAEGSYRRAIRICTGALKVGISRSDYWGKACLLRSKGLTSMGDFSKALDDMETTACVWTRSPFNASSEDFQEAGAFGVELAGKLLDVGDVEGARRAMSAGAFASGNPVSFLYEQAASLSESARKALWPEGPSVAFNPYGGISPLTFSALRGDVSRKLLGVEIKPNGGRGGAPCAILQLDAGAGNDNAFAVPANAKLSPKPFGLRLSIKHAVPADVKLALSFWFNRSYKTRLITDGAARDLGDGWTSIELQRDFLAECEAAAKKEGFDSSDGIINKIGFSLPAGPAVTCEVGKIEIFIPNAA
jgi:hypothetical protein